MRRNRAGNRRRLIWCRQAGRLLVVNRVVGRDTDANHGHILVHGGRRSRVSLIGHIPRRGHAAVLELWRHAVVLRRAIRVVVLIHGIHLLRRHLMLLRMILWHILRRSSSPSRTACRRPRHVDVGHAASSLYILPSRQMMAVTHPAGLGIRRDTGVAKRRRSRILVYLRCDSGAVKRLFDVVGSMANRKFGASMRGAL